MVVVTPYMGLPCPVAAEVLVVRQEVLPPTALIMVVIRRNPEVVAVTTVAVRVLVLVLQPVVQQAEQ